MLGRQPTLRDRLDSVGHDLQHRLEPLLSAADIAVGEMANFLDTPAAVEEALSEQRPLEVGVLAAAEQRRPEPAERWQVQRGVGPAQGAHPASPSFAAMNPKLHIICPWLQVPPSPAAAAGPPSGAEARQAAAAEAQLVRAAGVWVDPQKMLQDKLAFVLGEEGWNTIYRDGWVKLAAWHCSAIWYTTSMGACTSTHTVQHLPAPHALPPPSSASPAPPAATPATPPGVCNVVVTAFWVGRWPETYHHFW